MKLLKQILVCDQFIADKKLSCGAIAVEYNGRVIPENEWSMVFINENDSIEIVSFMGGG